VKLPGNLLVGAATHTGLQRSANEDDYLAVVLPAADGRAGSVLLAVADGMGGAAGGAEASRAALRALAASLLGSHGDAEERMRQGFAAACARVHEQSREVPSLRDMGSTLTVLLLHESQAAIGHVGDTRCLLVRGGGLAQLTTDHAVRTPESYLTRCIGGGQATEQPDVATVELQPGDRLALVTDGLWSTVEAADLLRVLTAMPPQAAAERLVRMANAAGGPDNATALVLEWQGAPADGAAEHEVALPREELSRSAELDRSGDALTVARWPWLALALAAALLAVAALRLVWGFDLLAWLKQSL
jgi:protein phosphatase